MPKTNNSQPSAAEETRRKLLLAAVQVFSLHGYEQATVRAICHHAGVNIAMVKYCFGDKRELYREVIRYVADTDAKLELLNRAVNGSPDPADALRQLIQGLLERLLATNIPSGIHLRLILNELTTPTSALTDEIETTLQPLYDQFCIVVGRVLQMPPKDVTTRLCVHSIFGQMAHYVHARPILNRLWPEMRYEPQQIRMIATHIADFSLVYLQLQKKPSGSRKATTSQRKPQ